MFQLRFNDLDILFVASELGQSDAVELLNSKPNS